MPDTVYVYTFSGSAPEDFHDFGRLEPGEQVRTMGPVDHPRLKLTSPAPDKSGAQPSASSTQPA